MKKYIVTGANGFIGRALLDEMSRGGEKVYAVVREKNENTDIIGCLPGVEVVYCELENIDDLCLMIHEDIDCLIHLAWSGSFGEARADHRLQLENCGFALKTVELCAKMGIKRFVGAGTIAECDVLNYHMENGAAPNAVSMYGIAKLNAHLMTKAECTRLGIGHIWCRLSNTYGIGNTTGNFVNMAAGKLLSGQRAAFTSGDQMYDFLYVTDAARAIYDCAVSGRNNCCYYLGSGEARPLSEYIRIIRDEIDPSLPLFLGEIPFNGKSLPQGSFSIEKVRNDTGFEPRVPFSEGIAMTVGWLKQKKTGGTGI